METNSLTKTLGIAGIFAVAAMVVAATGLLFYQVLAAFDDDLGSNNDLVFVVPKDQQKEDIVEALRRIQEDLAQTDTITDEDLQALDEIKALLDLSDDVFDQSTSTQP